VAPAPPPIAAERVLGMRAQLGLSAQQIDKLEAIRKEQLAERKTRMSEMLDLRSRLQAGDITRDQFRADLESRREAMRARGPQAGNRVREVLTDGQREKLQTMRRDAFRRQRAMAARGREFRRGGRANPGFGRERFRRGGFGPGAFGPGRGPALQRGPAAWGRGAGPGADGRQGQMWRRRPDSAAPAPRFNRVRPRPDSTTSRPPDGSR